MQLRKLKKAPVMIFVLCWCFMQPTLNAQDLSKQIRRLNKQLFNFQQEFLELKEQIANKRGSEKREQEQFELLITDLQKKNQNLINQVEDLKNQVEAFEQQLELSLATKLTSDLTALRKLAQILVLKSLNEIQAIDELLLEIINNPVSIIPKDLLLLFIADLMQRNQAWEQSLGYYSVLLSEFPESLYSPKAIYEMSEIFGHLNQTEEQRTLLLQLSYAKTPGIYTKLAKEKLEKMTGS